MSLIGMVTARHNNEEHDEPKTWYSESVLRRPARPLRDDHNLESAMFLLFKLAEG